ncbi:MAG: type II toxin-antitoxin system RelE/ParE family toxin [Deltaproteobacteria bacterium]|nr:type II toxin-antitoxin system RelE/ParE family toxin [Deltaproteobacteria bacterium]
MEIRTAFVDAVTLLAGGQRLAMPVSRNLANVQAGLHELRLKDRAGQIRVFYYIKRGDAIYVLHAFKKKSQGLPQREIAVALKRLREV